MENSTHSPGNHSLATVLIFLEKGDTISAKINILASKNLISKNVPRYKYANIRAEANKAYSGMVKRGATYDIRQGTDSVIILKWPHKLSRNTTRTSLLQMNFCSQNQPHPKALSPPWLQTDWPLRK